MEQNFQIFNVDDTKFRHPFTLTISGSTGSGKSEWVMRFLKNVDTLITNGPINKVFYCYGEFNQNIASLQKMGSIGGVQVSTHSGAPDEEMVKQKSRDAKGKLLMVLDDLMVGIGQNFLDTIFTRGSHNWGVSVVLVTQHLFSKELRIARNNSHYMVLMRNPAGALQVRTLATQLFPGRVGHLMEAYRDATEKQFGYLVVDMHPETSDLLRLKSNIYLTDKGEATIIYLPK